MRSFLLFTFGLLLCTFSEGWGQQPVGYAWIAKFDNGFSSTRVFSLNAQVNGFHQLTIQATSPTRDYVIEWNTFNDKWQNTSSPLNTPFILFHGGMSSPNGKLNADAAFHKHYTFVIEGLAYSDRNAVIMETTYAPQTFAGANPVTRNVSNPAPGQDIIITVNLNGNKSPEEKAFVRVAPNGNFASSQVFEVSFASSTASTGTAIIPGSLNTPGVTNPYYVYTTTVNADNSSPHDLISLRIANNGGSNFSYTVANTWETTGAAGTDWNDAATWAAGEVPPSNQPVTLGKNVNLTDTRSIQSLTINNGSTLTITGSNSLTIAGGGSFTNNGSFDAGNGKVIFAGAANLSGTLNFQDVDITGPGGVDFGTDSNINGILKITGGNAVNNGPSYAVGSTLVYSSGTTITQGEEFATEAETNKRPFNVQLTENVTLNLANVNKVVRNDLTIDGGSSMMWGANPNFVRVNGNVINNGTINLGTVPGGDLRCVGDFDGNNILNANQRAVFFEGTGEQRINSTTDPLQIDVIRIDKPSGEVKMLQNLRVSETQDPLSITKGTLNLNGFDLEIGKNAQISNIVIDEGAGIKGSNTSSITILGNGTATGGLRFTTGFQMLNSLTINRGGTTPSVNLNSDLTITSNLDIVSGVLNTGDNTITLATDATITEAGDNRVIGLVEATRTVNAETSADFGGMGIIINPTDNMGSTVVTRNTASGATNNSENSMSRIFNVNPTTNGSASVTYIYADGELGGREEEGLLIFKRGSNNVWTRIPDVTRNTAANSITFSVPSFSEITAHDKESFGDATLPVELISFTGSTQNGLVNLTWVTASELNNYGFEVERSYNARNFEPIGFVLGNGTTSMQHTYRFVDADKKSNEAYYRLRQVDFDGSYEYSPVIIVRNHDNKTAFSIADRNNHWNLEIALPEAEWLNLFLYDVTGKPIFSRQINHGGGTEYHQVLKPANNGIYLIEIQSRYGREVKKVAF